MSPLPLLLVAIAVAPKPAAHTGVEARLQGSFQMTGRVTHAVHVLGERTGKRVHRLWTFSSTCPSGACETVSLTRTREGGGSDTLTLALIAQGVYEGRGVFHVPLRCDGQVDPAGGKVPFSIRVRITAATPESFASKIVASYTNRRRFNFTRCPGGIGSDRANYNGAATGPPGTGPPPPSPAPPSPPPESTPPPTPPPSIAAQAWISQRRSSRS